VTPADSGAVRGVVLDVEGTTTPVSFVYDVLFPYARARLREFLAVHRDDAVVRDALAMLATEWAAESDPARPSRHPEHPPRHPEHSPRHPEHSPRHPERSEGSAAPDLIAAGDYLEWLMDRDRKSTALKIIQGEIWRGGFEDGALIGQMYPDVKPALERWRAEGRVVAIYSSGSAAAQQLLFGHSSSGDLTPLIGWHFDTTIGHKREPASYNTIARTLALPPASLLFISDVDAELAAARTAGLETRLCVRAGNAPPSASPVVRSFDEL
jgi:enolase-phosphatase E1